MLKNGFALKANIVDDCLSYAELGFTAFICSFFFLFTFFFFWMTKKKRGVLFVNPSFHSIITRGVCIVRSDFRQNFNWLFVLASFRRHYKSFIIYFCVALFSLPYALSVCVCVCFNHNVNTKIEFIICDLIKGRHEMPTHWMNRQHIKL